MLLWKTFGHLIKLGFASRNQNQGAKLSIPDAMLQSAQEVAEQGIAACLAGKPTMVTGFANRVSAAISHLFPKMTLANIAGGYYRKNLD